MEKKIEPCRTYNSRLSRFVSNSPEHSVMENSVDAPREHFFFFLEEERNRYPKTIKMLCTLLTKEVGIV